MDDFLEELRDDHTDFTQGQLGDNAKDLNPIELFKKWYKEAFDKECLEPNAMTVSTVGENLMPSSRIVYMKELTDEGFVFYTNYNSQKGKEIAQNPRVSLLFFWDEMARTVNIQGIAEQVDAHTSDEYFNSRPRESRIGAWASKQSEIITNRQQLEDALAQTKLEFEGKEVTRPPYWGGYVIRPLSIEFWQGRPSRLHDRICFKRDNVNVLDWEVFRKNP